MNKFVIRVSLLLSLLLLVYFSFIIIKYPLLGMKVIEGHDHYLEVTEIHPVSWSNEFGLEPGQVILLENQNENSGQIKVEMIEQITIEESDELINYNVVYTGTSIEFIIISFLPILVCLFNVLLATYLTVKYNKASMNLLAVLFLIIGLTYISASVSARGNLVGVSINSIGLMMCPVLLLSVFNEMNFEKIGTRLIQKKNLWFVMGLVILLGIMDVYLLVLNANTNGILLYAFLILLLFTFLPLVKLFKNISDYLNKYKLRLFLYSIVIGFLPFLVFYVIPLLFFDQIMIRAEYTAISLLMIPFVGVYLMIINVLPDLSYELNRLKEACKLSIIPSFVCSIIIYFLFIEQRQFIDFISIFTIILILIVLLIQPTKHSVVQFDESFLTLAVSGRKVKKKESLYVNLKNEIEQRIDISVTHLQYERNQGYFCMGEFVSGLESLKKEIDVRKERIEVGTLFSTSSGYYLIVGMNMEQYDLFYLPYKKGIIKYNKAEREWLKAISIINQSMLENLNNINEIVDELEVSIRQDHNQYSKFSQLHLLISERESERISNDIHDTLLQELIHLYRGLNVEDGPNNDKLLYIKERILDQIDLLRETCFELNPVFRNEFDFFEAINHLILNYQVRENMKFSLIIKRPFLTKLTDVQRISLYRIIQELLNNAVKHSKADQVLLELSSDQNHMILEYHDDGVGMDLDSSTLSNKNYGILGIKQRVKNLNGTILFSSEAQKGLSVAIKIEVAHEVDLLMEDFF